MESELAEQGKRIRAWREAAGLSEKEVCDRFGWKLSHYRQYESGKVEIESYNAYELAEMFGTSAFHMRVYMPGEKIKVYKTRSYNPRPLPNKDVLRALFDYNQDTGVFIYKKADFSLFKSGRSFDSHHNKIGKRADKNGAGGYKTLRVAGEQFAAHRMAILYVQGPFSLDMEVDHLNGDRGDNRWSNIRLVTSAQNSRNVPQKGNKSGYLGVTEMATRKKSFRATCSCDGITFTIFPFDTPIEAFEKLEELKEKMGLGFGPRHAIAV